MIKNWFEKTSGKVRLLENSAACVVLPLIALLPAAEVVAMISEWEEDYHLHRHFELLPSSHVAVGQPTYSINGTAYSAILFRDTICDVLGR